jgi:hypothetical protein
VIVWGLPIGVVRFVLRRALKYQLNSGLRAQLKQKTQEQLVNSLKPMIQGLLGQQDSTRTIIEVDKRLWIDELKEDFRPLISQQLMKILWDVILDIIAPSATAINAGTNNQTQGPAGRVGLFVRIKSRLIGDFQFVKMWNDALNAALPAAREAAYGKANPSVFESTHDMHVDMFSTAFKAASEAALKAAKQVAEDTREEMNNPKRDAMWKRFWDVWESSRTSAEETVVQVVQDAAEEIVKLVAKSVVEAVGNNSNQHFMALISDNVSRLVHPC